MAWADPDARPVSDYYREHVWVTPAGLYSQHQLQYMVAELGAERIIHSEDFPYVVRDDVEGFLREADLSPAQRHAIAHGNAEVLLGL